MIDLLIPYYAHPAVSSQKSEATVNVMITLTLFESPFLASTTKY